MQYTDYLIDSIEDDGNGQTVFIKFHAGERIDSIHLYKNDVPSDALPKHTAGGPMGNHFILNDRYCMREYETSLGSEYRVVLKTEVM